MSLSRVACPSLKPVSTHDRYFYGPEEDDESASILYKNISKLDSVPFTLRVRAGTWSMAVKMHHIHSDALRIERQKSHIETEKTKQEKRAYKTKALDLEILKIQMAMKFPFRILQRIE
jgi:hypothetical protein